MCLHSFISVSIERLLTLSDLIPSLFKPVQSRAIWIYSPWPKLNQEPCQRTTSGTTIKPKHQGIFSWAVLRFHKPLSTDDEYNKSNNTPQFVKRDPRRECIKRRHHQDILPIKELLSIASIQVASIVVEFWLFLQTWQICYSVSFTCTVCQRDQQGNTKQTIHCNN